MATRSYARIPSGQFARQQFYEKIAAFIVSRFLSPTAAEQFTVRSFFPPPPVRRLGQVTTSKALSYGGQIITTWLYGYGYEWNNSTTSGTQVYFPMNFDADVNVFPLTPFTGFWAVGLDVNAVGAGVVSEPLNPLLVDPFPNRGRIPSYEEALFYWLPRGLRNTQRVSAFREANRLLEFYTRQQLIPLFLSNPSSVSDDDLEMLGLRPRRGTHHSPLPAPEIAPSLNVTVGQNHNIKVVVLQNNLGGHRRLMVRQRGIRGFRLDWRFVDQREFDVPPFGEKFPSAGIANHNVLPQSAVGWNSQMSTRLKQWIMFNEQDRGRIVEIRAAFLNPRLEAGPVSDPVTAVIS